MPLSYNKDDHILGDPGADITVLLYEDYECEYCGKYFRELKRLYKYFREKICIIYRNFPHIQSHPFAFSAALIAEASSKQNKFMQVHDIIFEHQEYLEYGIGGILRLLEKDEAISMAKLKEDMKRDELKSKINRDIETALKNNVENTPAVFINRKMWKGVAEFKHLVKAVRAAISINERMSITRKAGHLLEMGI